MSGCQSCLYPDVARGQLAVDETDTPIRPGSSVEAVLVGDKAKDVLGGEIDSTGNVQEDASLLREAGPVVHLQGSL